jgi:hypothetical protein|tara:strand:+ start:371 stop:562 length:192 start_codon:yes stop_codon:yes gene_type:complete
MNKICTFLKKKRVIPQKPCTEKKEPFKNNHREIIQRKKSNLQIRTGKNLKIIPIGYKGNFKKI